MEHAIEGCKDNESEPEKFVEKYVTIHQHNLPLLMVEIFKTKNNLNVTFMESIFTERNIHYNLRTEIHSELPNVKTTMCGIENIQYIGHYL